MGGKPGSRTKMSNKEATETRQEDRASQLRKDNKERDEACELNIQQYPPSLTLCWDKSGSNVAS